MNVEYMTLDDVYETLKTGCFLGYIDNCPEDVVICGIYRNGDTLELIYSFKQTGLFCISSTKYHMNITDINHVCKLNYIAYNSINNTQTKSQYEELKNYISNTYK